MGHVLMVGMVLEWKDIWYGYWVVTIFVMLLSTLVTLSGASHERERETLQIERERGGTFSFILVIIILKLITLLLVFN